MLAQFTGRKQPANVYERRQQMPDGQTPLAGDLPRHRLPPNLRRQETWLVLMQYNLTPCDHRYFGGILKAG